MLSRYQNQRPQSGSVNPILPEKKSPDLAPSLNIVHGYSSILMRSGPAEYRWKVGAVLSGLELGAIVLCTYRWRCPAPTRFILNASKVSAGSCMSALCDTQLGVNSLVHTYRIDIHSSVQMRTPLVDCEPAENVMLT